MPHTPLPEVIICTLHQISLWWSNQRPCRTHGEEGGRCKQDFGGKTWRWESTWKTLA
jgi:hypothetical protein